MDDDEFDDLIVDDAPGEQGASLPPDMRETGESRTTVQLGETHVVGDPEGRRGSVSYSPTGEGVVEERLIEKAPKDTPGPGEHVGWSDQMGDPRPLQELYGRALSGDADAWGAINDRFDPGAEERGAGTIGGMELPSIESTTRAVQSDGDLLDRLGAWLPTATGSPSTDPAVRAFGATRGMPQEDVQAAYDRGIDVRGAAPAQGVSAPARWAFNNLARGIAAIPGEGQADRTAAAERYISENNDLADRVSEQAPGEVTAGETAMITGLTAPLAGPAAGMNWLGRIGLAGAEGGVLGALRGSGEADTADLGEAASAGVDEGLVGAALGAGTAGLIEGGSPILRRLGEWATGGSQAAQRSADRYRNAAAGARYASEVDDISDPAEFARIVREQGISRGLRSTAASGERAAGVRRAANQEITGLADEARTAAQAERQRMAETADQFGGLRDWFRRNTGSTRIPGTVRSEDLRRSLSAVRDSIEGQGAPAVGARRQIDDMIERYDALAARGDGGVSIDTLMADWRAFGRPSNFRPDQPWNVLADSRRDLRRVFREQMESAMESAAGPEARRRLSDALEQVHVGRVLERGAERVAARGHGNRVISLTDMIGGSSAGAGTFAATGDPITSAAVGGATMLGNRVLRGREHALAATGLEGLAGGLRRLGPRTEQFAATLEAAGRRGTTHLAAAHYALMRQHPAYRDAIDAMQGADDDQDADAYDDLIVEGAAR